MIISKKTTLGISPLCIAAVLVIACSSLTTRGGVAYAQDEFNVDLAIDSVSLDTRTREVTVDFTVTCSEPSESAEALIRVRQGAGEKGHFGPVKSVEGLGHIEFECSGETPLSVTIEAETGFFTGGSASVSGQALACSELECDFDVREQVVRVSQSR